MWSCIDVLGSSKYVEIPRSCRTRLASIPISSFDPHIDTHCSSMLHPRNPQPNHPSLTTKLAGCSSPSTSWVLDELQPYITPTPHSFSIVVYPSHKLFDSSFNVYITTLHHPLLTPPFPNPPPKHPHPILPLHPTQPPSSPWTHWQPRVTYDS